MYKFSNSKSGPTGGETFTVTCFTCGMPSSKEWAQLVQSRPCSPDLSVPFYPFLLQATPPPGALYSENGTYLCAFCHALLEAQWNSYEGKKEPLSPLQRKYIIHKFICAVCGVETYRKRVRALPFQEFPFLAKTRQPGSITLGNNPLAVVCLDCSETLWAQSAEYDRWGLPVHKRHFNWMARPPPPEDSVEATVARLPSGETQLPRCPPTDPLVPSKTNEPNSQPEAIPPIKYSRPRPNSVLGGSREDVSGSFISQQAKYYQQPLVQRHRQGMSPLSLIRGPQTSPKKVTNVYLEPNSASSSSSLDVVSPHIQPPIVTVAPMSLHHSVQSSRKNSVVYTLSNMEDRSSPNNKYGMTTSSYGRTSSSAHHHHHESSSHHDHHHPSAPHYPPHLVPYYSPTSWPSQTHLTNEDGLDYGEQDYCGTGHRHPSSEGSAWRQRDLPNTLHSLRPYISPNNNHHHERTVSDPNFSTPASLLGHPLSLAALFPQLRLQQSATATSLCSGVRVESPSSRISSSSPRDYENYRTSPSRIGGPTSDEHHHRSRAHSSSSKRHRYPHHPPNISHNDSSEDDTSVGRSTKKINPKAHVESSGSEYYQNVQRRSSPFEDVLVDRSGGSSGDCDEMADEAHPLLSEIGDYQPGSSRRRDFLVPKKRHWQPSPSTQCFVPSPSSSPSDNPSSVHADSKSSDSSEIRSVLAKKRKFSTNPPDSREGTIKSDFNFGEESISQKSILADTNTHGAIDLSMTQPGSRQLPKSASKFSIAYLSKSETFPVPVNEGDVEPVHDSFSQDPLISKTVIFPSVDNPDCRSDIVQNVKKNITEAPSQTDDEIDDNANAASVHCSIETTSLLSLKKVNFDESVSLKTHESLSKPTTEFLSTQEDLDPNEIRDRQSSFLSQLGLVMPLKRTGPNDRGTTLPLKLKDICLARIPFKHSVQDSPKTKEIETAQALFLQTLGLQPSIVAKNTEREQNVDVIHQIRSVSGSSTRRKSIDSKDGKGNPKISVKPICIKYPKYVPGAVDIEQTNAEKQNEASGDVVQEEQKKCADPIETVLRIPVVHKQITNFEDDIDAECTLSESGSSEMIQSTKPSTSEIPTLQRILETSAFYFKKSNKLLAKAMKEIKSSSGCMDDQLSQLETIRKYISTQQSSIHESEAEFIELETHIIQRGAERNEQQSLPKP